VNGHAEDPDLEPASSALVFQIAVCLCNAGGIAAGTLLGELLGSPTWAAWGMLAGSILGSLLPLVLLWRPGRLVPRLVFVLASIAVTVVFSGVVGNITSILPPPAQAQLVKGVAAAGLAGVLACFGVWAGRFVVSQAQRIEQVINGGTRAYISLLGVALRRRFLVLGAVFVLFVGSLLLTFGIGREFFPQVDAGQLTIYVRAPCNLRLDATESRVAEVEKVINELIPSARQGGDRETVISEIGLDPDWSAAYTANSGQQDAVVRIQLTEQRHKSAQEYAIMLRQAFADRTDLNDLRFAFDTGGMVSAALNMGASSPIDLEVSGGSDDQTYDMAKKIRDRILDVRGAADIRVLQRRDAPYMMIDVDRQKAASVGLSGEDVILQVVAAMNSSVAINRNFWIDVKSGNQYFVGVQYPEDRGMKIEDVLNVFATGTHQPSAIKLGSLVHISRKSGSVEVNHIRGYRTYNVQVNTQARDVGGVARDVQKRIKSLQKLAWTQWVEDGKKLKKQEHRVIPPASELFDKDGYRFPLEPDPKRPDQTKYLRVQLKGEYSRMNESTANLAWGLAGAALLVYLLQVALFRSWAGPFVIMFTVPLGLIGVLTMLFVTRTTLNVQSQMGVIFLVGIAVNNGVLLVEFANKLRRSGQPVVQAIQGAAAIRFRPIFMTFLATFLALIPMAVGLERGCEANIPLARAVVGGLLTSTFLTLFVVPIMYTLLMKDPLPPEVDLEAELADRPASGAVASSKDNHDESVGVTVFP
jgi:multidrug efflux pump subunit AcrB